MSPAEHLNTMSELIESARLALAGDEVRRADQLLQAALAAREALQESLCGRCAEPGWMSLVWEKSDR